MRFKNELERNITIKLGYANAKIYKCADPRCPRPACYKAYGSSKEDNPKCDVPGEAGGRGPGTRSGGSAAQHPSASRVCVQGRRSLHDGFAVAWQTTWATGQADQRSLPVIPPPPRRL